MLRLAFWSCLCLKDENSYRSEISKPIYSIWGGSNLGAVWEELEVVVKVLQLLLLLPLLQELLHQAGARVAMVVKSIQCRGWVKVPLIGLISKEAKNWVLNSASFPTCSTITLGLRAFSIWTPRAPVNMRRRQEEGNPENIQPCDKSVSKSNQFKLIESFLNSSR